VTARGRAGGDRARPRRPPRRRRTERGFTLIELMVALVVSSLLVGMIFAIFIRMSTAYRTQQQVAEVQSKLAAARARIELDAKQAGFGMSGGFYMAFPGGVRVSPLRVINNADAPDEIAFFYADPSVQVATRADVGATCTRRLCDQLGSTEGFRPGDVVVMSTLSWGPAEGYEDPGEPKVAQFMACLFQLSSVGPTSFSFSEAAPWGSFFGSHCPSPPVVGTTMFYKLAARHWRIDPSRPAEGVLQLSTGGALVRIDDWQDQAYGFTDLQVATRFFEPRDLTDTPDPDADPRRDWYSGEQQEINTEPAAALLPPIQVSISLVARTERDVEGIASASTPDLTVAGNEDHNTVGDRGPIPLPSELPALAGHRIYRHTTFQVDLRNLGIGR
jgi:prepilin-type N-terminal cleavage/methylation domain-containing protein